MRSVILHIKFYDRKELGGGVNAGDVGRVISYYPFLLRLEDSPSSATPAGTPNSTIMAAIEIRA